MGEVAAFCAGVVLPTLITVALIVMGASTPGEFLVVRGCIALAAADVFCLTIWWLYRHGPGTPSWQHLAGAAVIALLIVTLPLLFRWVDQKELIAVNTPRNAGILIYSPGKSAVAVPKIQLGTSHIIVGAKEIGRDTPADVLLFPALSESQFKIELIDGRVKVSTQIRDENNKLIVELVKNEWKVLPPPGTWDRNYSDDALEVRDGSGAIVLQVKLFSDRVQIQGMWWVDLGPPNGIVRFVVRGNPTIGGQIIIIPTANKDPLPTIDAMFVYPSDAHLGELRQ
jgi:hypothetical protein